MKNLFSFFLVLLTATVFAQAPQQIKYQGVARDAAGAVIANGTITVQFDVHDVTPLGTIIYTETHTGVTTNQFGLFSISIGSITPFPANMFGTGDEFLEVSVDFGSGLTSMGTSQFLSVPYAIYAETSGSSTPGPQGPTGPQGTAGVTGAQGPSGDPGATGAQGPIGNDGPTGPQGIAGATGAQGPSGDPGATGAQGPIGNDGPTGPQGVAGVNGATGAQGPIGNDGPTGPQGAVGATGAQGPIGNDGPTGPQGIQGVAGTVGPMGPQGPAGSNGTNGATGPQGVAGPTGLTGATGATGAPGSGGMATYRWTTFHTYDENNWVFGNSSLFTGGVAPQQWTDNSATASMISPNKDIQRAMFTQKGYAKENALVHSEIWNSYSSTNGIVTAALFRVSNYTGGPIVWNVSFYYTCYAPWSEVASLTVNGANTWNSGTPGSVTVPCTIPTGQVSTVIVVSTSRAPSANIRSNQLAFFNNCLTLPAGLTFVDDLDTATGGWSN